MESGAQAVNGPLLLADISGYTSFLVAVQEAHKADAFADGAIPDAYALMSRLLDGIIDRLIPPYTLAKLEGDAVFAYAPGDADLPRGADLLDGLVGCYRDFRTRLSEAIAMRTCECGACTRDTALELKFVLHAGPFVIQSIGGGRELVGPDVVMAHRLLKTGAAQVVGSGAYAVISDVAATRYEVPTDTAVALVEQVEHYPPIQLHVFPMRSA